VTKQKLNKEIGKKLAALRASKKQSQQEFADQAGITRGYYSDLERGEREMSVQTLAALCKSHRTTAAKVLGF
jgi:transcriptional regulator with XRE-family HTH domain